MARKIDAMHQMFGRYSGREPKKCKDCCNFIRKKYDKVYRKCIVYGNTNGEATDWKTSYEACELFNRNYEGNRVIDILKRSPKPKDNEPIEGQISLSELIGGD